MFGKISGFIALFLVLVSCKPGPTQSPDASAPPSASSSATWTPPVGAETATRTPEPATATARPTETATATPEAGIDMEKFQHLPENYEYLQTHLDEFVRAPDPLTERAAFDRWWNEKLIPALGPVSERPLTADTYRMGPSRFSYKAVTDGLPMPLTGRPSFFYFENDGVVYPVPCMNVTTRSFSGETKMTVCAALTDYIPLSRAGTNSLEMFDSPTDFVNIEVYLDLTIEPDVDWGRLTEVVPSLGERVDDDNHVVFGFGRIVFERNY